MQKSNNLAPSITNFELQARPELLDIVETVARDKGISVDEVFEAMEMAIKKVAVAKYGNLYNIKAAISKANGSISIKKVVAVVEEVENHYHEITLEEAKAIDPNLVIGDEIVEVLPNPDFARGSVQSFRQVVVHKVREAEKQREYELYKDKVGEIVNGVVKRVEFGNAFVELANRGEALLRRDQSIAREYLEVGARLRALVIDVKKDTDGAQILLSRNSAEFIKKLFMQEIPEVYEGVVEIKAIARDAGSRSKIAVISKDPSIDPISVCVGFKGARIHGILEEVRGEKIDLIQWSENIANFVVNAFNPIAVVKVIVDEDRDNIGIVVAAESLSLAIGRRGQNINLISKLVGWKIDIMSEDIEQERRQSNMQQKIDLFKDSLDVDDVIAQLLAVEGFNSISDVLNNTNGLKAIPGFNDEIIEELQNRCRDHLDSLKKEQEIQIKELGVEEQLFNLLVDKQELLLDLAKQKILTVEDLADLSMFDLLDIVKPADYNLNKNDFEQIILNARNINS